ncbi:uncharacterized protein LOC144023000 isoform X2 [Festucalex cinctus]
MQLHTQRMRRIAARLRLKSSSNVSLHQRFSRGQSGQAMRPHVANIPESVLLLVRPSPSVNPQAGPACFSLVPVAPPPPQRGSVWTRLGCRRVGFWNFRNKYGWRGRCRAARRRARASARLAWRRRPLVRTGSGPFRRVARGQVAASALPVRGRSLKAPSKKELDAQLDDYMSKSKRRLDADLDHYMARSKKRLDADLDEYMALGRYTLPWAN